MPLNPDEIIKLRSMMWSKMYRWSIKPVETMGIMPDAWYSPSEIAAILKISYDTAIRRMRKMHGVKNLGSKEGRYKRGRAMLRIKGSDLLEYLEGKPHGRSLPR